MKLYLLHSFLLSLFCFNLTVQACNCKKSSAKCISQANWKKLSAADKLKSSLALWQKRKKQYQGNYSYQITQYIPVASFRGITTVVIRNNVIVKREYRKAVDGKKPKLVYTENAKNINSHKQGAKAITLDELYLLAKQLMAKKLPEEHNNAKKVFAFNSQHILEGAYIRESILGGCPIPPQGVVFDQDSLKLGK